MADTNVTPEATEMPTDNISFAAENPPADAQAPAPDNNGVDEDLLINQKSSSKDKRDYYLREARKAGRDYAAGTASQLTLAEKILEGAVNG